MAITTKNASALIDTKLGVPKQVKKQGKKSGKYPQQTRPARGPRRSR